MWLAKIMSCFEIALKMLFLEWMRYIGVLIYNLFALTQAHHFGLMGLQAKLPLLLLTVEVYIYLIIGAQI